ncbi:hypothetical protein M5689_008219 [Euphorbia peplus]|nr:hypothetical protein M5689_008219 [Euphorbia peplus]
MAYGELISRCFLLMFFVTLGIAFGIIVSISMYVNRLTFPKTTFQIDSALLNSFNISDSHLTANWNFSITVKKTDSSALNCEKVEVSLLLNDVVVSSMPVQDLSFKEKDADEKTFKVNLTSSDVLVNGTESLSLSLNISYLGTMKEQDFGDLWFTKKSEKVQHVVMLCENLKVVSVSNYFSLQASFPFMCNKTHSFSLF